MKSILQINNIPEELKEIEISLEYLLQVVSNLFNLYQSSRIDKKRKCKTTVSLIILSKQFEYYFSNVT